MLLCLYDSQAPNVDFRSVLLPWDEELWCCILWAPTVCLQQASRLGCIAQAKVCARWYYGGSGRRQGSLESLAKFLCRLELSLLTNYLDLSLSLIQQNILHLQIPE